MESERLRESDEEAIGAPGGTAGASLPSLCPQLTNLVAMNDATSVASSFSSSSLWDSTVAHATMRTCGHESAGAVEVGAIEKGKWGVENKPHEGG